MNISSKNAALFIGIAGVILFSTKAVVIKLAYQHDVDPLSLLLLRMLFALPIYTGILLLSKPRKEAERNQVRKRDYLWLFMAGMLGYYLASFFDFLGLVYIKASLERVILFVYPTIVVLLSYLIFRKKITRRQAVSIFVTYVGIIVTFATELQISGGDKVVLGAFLIFVSAVAYAAYLVSSNGLIAKFGTLRFTAYAMIVSCICVSTHFLVTLTFGSVDPMSIFQFSPIVYYYTFFMAVFCTVIPSFMVSHSIKYLGASNFAVVGSLGPISTIFLAFIFLGETMNWMQVLGTILVIIGVYIISKDK